MTWYLTWMSDAWRPIAAFTYLFICIIDFVVAPFVHEFVDAHSRSAENLVTLSLKFDGGAAQVQALTVLRNQQAWTPLTLGENGLFHIAFGAILGAASWTKGQERIRMVTASMQDSSLDYGTRVQKLQEASAPPVIVPPPPPPVPEG